MLRSIFSILFFLLPFAVLAQKNMGKGTSTSPADSIVVRIPVIDTAILPATDTTLPKIKDGKDSLGQLRIGFDFGKLLLNQLAKDSLSSKSSYEFEIDYYFKKELYLVAEAGWGGGSVSYNDLRYSANNIFIKAGINKSLLLRLGPNDWDQAIIGARYAVGFINRIDAFYETTDDFWGNSKGTIPGRNITGHWFELTGGTRIELYKGIFVGWNIRGKFRLNRKPFEELPPYYIAGYGKGDKNSIFDFNFYLCYGIRWAK